ncbi:uncharacterized protein PG986_004158 [Apiospora aurea]|uniref:Uncharacterized protein n=1 Tax=Apiospora aurea TaxID=335848 RepID=A0ABR1QNC8_9PEZI
MAAGRVPIEPVNGPFPENLLQHVVIYEPPSLDEKWVFRMSAPLVHVFVVSHQSHYGSRFRRGHVSWHGAWGGGIWGPLRLGSLSQEWFKESSDQIR